MYDEYVLQLPPDTEALRFRENTDGGDPAVFIYASPGGGMWTSVLAPNRPADIERGAIGSWLSLNHLSSYNITDTGPQYTEVELVTPTGEHTKYLNPEGKWRNADVLFWVALHDGRGGMQLVSHNAIAPSLAQDRQLRSKPRPYASLRFYVYYTRSLYQWLLMEGFGVIDFAPSETGDMQAIYLVLVPPK